MQRVGYDTDSQIYTFRDTDGSLWQSAPGNYYGKLTQIENPSSAENPDSEMDSRTSPPPRPRFKDFGQTARDDDPAVHHEGCKLLTPFLFIIRLVLQLLVRRGLVN
jgi:hypothetical protein